MDRKVSLINLSKLSQLEFVTEERCLDLQSLALVRNLHWNKNRCNLWQDLLWVSRKRKILSRFIERLDLLIGILWLPYVKTIHTQLISKKHNMKNHIIQKLGNGRLKGCLCDNNPAGLCICIKLGSQITLALSNAQHGWGVPNKQVFKSMFSPCV